MDRPSDPASRLVAAMILATSSTVLSAPSSAESAPDLDQLTAAQAAADLCSGKFTSKALVSAAIARAKAKANLNAFITLDDGPAGSDRRLIAIGMAMEKLFGRLPPPERIRRWLGLRLRRADQIGNRVHL